MSVNPVCAEWVYEMKCVKSLIVALFVLFSFACGGGSSPAPTAPTPAPAPAPVPAPITPAASVSATGNGSLVVHPSGDSRFCCAIEMPIILRETAGGSAGWNFARFQTFRNGVAVEVNELGSDVIAAANLTTVSANSSSSVKLYFHLNSSNFTTVSVTLGMGDRKDSPQF